MEYKDEFQDFELKCRECLTTISLLDDMVHKLLAHSEIVSGTDGEVVKKSLLSIANYAAKVSMAFEVDVATR